jgi:alkylresorcinol/alkylpyrone synthase
MPTILAASHCSPSHRFEQKTLGDLVAGRAAQVVPGLPAELVTSVFAHSRIRRRAFLMPLDWYFSPHTWREQNAVFMEQGLPLLVEASVRTLEQAHLGIDQVSHVIFATSTGLSTPSLDSHLMNALGISRNATRLPIWGLGCAAGASGLARAYDHCLAHPEAVVLFTALEACSINFKPEDDAKKNIIAMSLFSDCCGAVVVAGDKVRHDLPARPRIVATHSHLTPDSTAIAGWAVTDQGFRLVLSPELPALARAELGPVFDAFLRRQGLAMKDIIHYLFHPGGAKVMDTIAETLQLSREALRLSEEVLRDFGNISSVSVLVVLERWLNDSRSRVPGYGVLAAFGPGYSTELVLMKS